ncbi:hypothetical protein CEXT_563471, partial [Caerostris extrusa]
DIRSLTFELESVILVEGSLEKVVCVAEGEPPLTYTWYNKFDRVITSRCKKLSLQQGSP